VQVVQLYETKKAVFQQQVYNDLMQQDVVDYSVDIPVAHE